MMISIFDIIEIIGISVILVLGSITFYQYLNRLNLKNKTADPATWESVESTDSTAKWSKENAIIGFEVTDDFFRAFYIKDQEDSSYNICNIGDDLPEPNYLASYLSGLDPDGWLATDFRDLYMQWLSDRIWSSEPNHLGSVIERLDMAKSENLPDWIRQELLEDSNGFVRIEAANQIGK